MLSKVWTAFLLFGAAASVVAWCIALCHEKGIRPIAGAVRFVRGLPWGGRLVLLPLFLALVVYGSTKYVGEGQGEGEVQGEGQGEGEGQGVGVDVGGESISNRVERVDRVDEGESGFNAENAEGAESGWGSSLTGLTELTGLKDNHVNLVNPVENSQLQTSNSQLTTFNSELITPTVCEDWLKFGGFEDWIYLGPGGWSFRHGSNFVERLAVFSSGKIRLLKQGGGDAWIALSAVPVSIVPMANWGLINFRCRDVCEGQGEGVGESGFGHVERVDRVDGGESGYLAQSPQSSQSWGLDNVANVEMFPITNTNSQLENGIGNWQHSHNGNINNSQLLTYNSQLTTHPSSLFWHAETPSNTLLLTWCNALLNRDTNSPVNIQAELFPSGNMLITHDLSGDFVTEYIPAPELPFVDTLDEVMSRIEGGNSNAYFFADVAVSKGPAIVNVKSEYETTLGNYSFVAYPDVTNRLPFLIGPKYEVQCEAAYSYFSVTNTEVVASNLTDRITAVQWPVTIDFDEGYDFGGGKMFEVTVDPPFLNGTMEFEGSMNGNIRMFSPRSSGGCGCEVSVAGGIVTVMGVCSNDTCVHEGSYVYEGYHEHIEFECGMGPEEDPEPELDEPEPPEDENEPGVSVWFEEKAVIFEDEYENAPGETVSRRSTRTTLKCWAYGGELGGNFTVDLSEMGALKLVSGTPPSGRTLGPGEYVEFEAEYEAEKASSRENGTVAKVSFIENKTNITFDDEDKMTVVKVEISPVNQFPSGYPNRHIFGVCEKFECQIIPDVSYILWNDIEDVVWDEKRDNYRSGFMPMYSCVRNLTLGYARVSFDAHLTCVTPSGIDATLFSISSVSGSKNMAGDIGMLLKFSLLPSNVSFAGLRVSEDPSSHGVHTGYFSDSLWSDKWSHTSENGAGTWHTVDSKSNYYAMDEAYIGNCPPPWSSGVLSWEIPNVWLPPTGRGGENVPIKTTFKVVWQTMSIIPDGTVSVSKHGHTVSRSTNDVITINGVVLQ